jgi:hypothetical protein
LRHVVAPRTGRLVQEELAIAGGSFRILIDGDDDRLHRADSGSLHAWRDDASAGFLSLFLLAHRAAFLYFWQVQNSHQSP